MGINHSSSLRNENKFLPANFRSSDNPAQWGDIFGYYRVLFAQHVDAVFADQPDTAIMARDEAASQH